MDAPTPAISIVTPAYNAERFLGETIRSVLDQTLESWELIIVDDCSTDETRTIAAEYRQKDQRIRLIALERNFGGPAGPRNVGVRSARGEWVAFLDADDLWHPRKLEMQLAAALDSGAAFVCSRMEDFTESSSAKMPANIPSGRVALSFLMQSIRSRIPTSTVLARKSLLISFPFVEDISYKAVEDYDCWLRILQSGAKCIKLKAPLMFYRKAEGQISGSKIDMIKRVFMMNSRFPGRSFVAAVVFTTTHIFGGAYRHLIKKGM